MSVYNHITVKHEFFADNLFSRFHLLSGIKGFRNIYMRIHFEKSKYINGKSKLPPSSSMVQPRKKGEKFMFYSISSSDVEKWDIFVFIKV